MDQQTPITQEIRNFLESLLQDSGMTYDDQLKEEMIKELYARLDSYLTSVIAENLSDEDVEVFIKMNEEKRSKEEIENFIKQKLPNANEIFTNAFMDFRSMYLGSVTAKRDAQNLEEKQ